MRLLVSVRNAREAADAIAGGCDILDVKEPDRGPLGMADFQQIREVVKLGEQRGIPVSAALGECQDWYQKRDRESASFGSLPPGLSFLKLGLADMLRHSNWFEKWQKVRHDIEALADGLSAESLRKNANVSGEGRLAQSLWVAVAYADHEACDAPPPRDVIAAAAASGCCGVLMDTWRKDGRNLIDHVSASKLSQLVDTTHHSGLFFAAAGSLSLNQLGLIAQCGTDIVGVRGAACFQKERTSAISREAVDSWQRGLRELAPA